MHVFMDTFQGCYRTHPRDLRYFSAFYLLLRVFLLVQWYIFFSDTTEYTSGILSLAGAAAIAVFQPYKVKAHNKVDVVLLLLMATYFNSVTANPLNDQAAASPTYYVISVFEGLSLALPTLYFITVIVWKLFHSRIKVLVRKVQGLCKHSSTKEEVVESFIMDRHKDQHTNNDPLLSK